MNDFNHPCVVFALKRERIAFCRKYRPQRPCAGAPCWAHFCAASQSQILVVETGVGRKKTERALDWLFAQPIRPSSIIMAGFCGALRSEYEVGDVIVPSEIVDINRGTQPDAAEWLLGVSRSPSLRCEAGAKREAILLTPRLSRKSAREPAGRILTVSKLIADPDEKARLATRYDADAVDMESAVVARRCHKENIPFTCVRAVSDDSRTALSSQLVSLLANGRVSFRRTAAALLRRPQMIREMLQLARNTNLAAQRLAQALAGLLSPSVDR